MSSNDKRAKREEDSPNVRPSSAGINGSYAANSHIAGSSNGVDAGRSKGSGGGYTLMVAGQRTGKTSFLRILLDTCEISQSASKDQLTSVAKFVQGCSGHTSHIRTVTVDVGVDVDGNGAQQRLTLSLIDTPSLDFGDETSAERSVSEMLRHVDSRYAEGIEDEWKAQSGDHHVHLCIYFLDPDHIVPPYVTGPPAPPVSRPRARTNSFSHSESEPVILEAPVTTNPLLCRPTLPLAEISTIRRLSARVNVLPVIARADTLTNDRLAAVKYAVRKDLAEAGIGFGIFDIDNPNMLQRYKEAMESPNFELPNGYPTHSNGSSSSMNSPPSPGPPLILKLPYSLISPDAYSHSDGVPRTSPSRHELALQYTPSVYHAPSTKIIRGKFIRSYRWGSLDVMDPAHSDFLLLRTAVFHHMETLQKYTREYLFDKFRTEYNLHHHPLHRHIPQGQSTRSHHLSISHNSRPILAIDTAPDHSSSHRHTSLVGRDISHGDLRSAPVSRPISDHSPSNHSARQSASRSSKQRTKKITVACNFCRSRKLKCDGGRPACSQCLKRSNPCDYMPQNKRRNTTRQQKLGEDSESDISGEEPTPEYDEPSLSPEIHSLPLSRRSSVADKHREGFNSAFPGPLEQREDPPPLLLPQSAPPRLKPLSTIPSPEDQRHYYHDNELPHIATLPLNETSHDAMGSLLPPIRPASEQQAAQRKRAVTGTGKARSSSNSGPKVVACNFCRARKTKCDGGHPACSSCARRSLPCNYVHDNPGVNGSGQKRGSRRASTSKVGGPTATSTPSPNSPPSAQGSYSVAPSRGSNGYTPHDGTVVGDDSNIDMKRNLDEPEAAMQPQKKMRMETSPTTVVGIP